jgi:hypothetical protein
MRRDKHAPALLELIAKNRPVPVPMTSAPPPVAPPTPSLPSSREVMPRPQPGPASTSIEEAGNWFSPGRSVRVPVGYLVPLILLAAALIVGAYATGYQARKAEESRAQSDTAAAEMSALVDPLTQPAPAAANTPARLPPAIRAPATATRSADAALNAGAARAPGYIVVHGPNDDPRQAGLNYLIAATLPRDEAEKAAQFLDSKGLEIAVVPVDNQGSRWVVVVVQGVAAKDLGGPAARSLEQRLQALGREYKQTMKGPTVFNDPWWKKHTK